MGDNTLSDFHEGLDLAGGLRSAPTHWTSAEQIFTRNVNYCEMISFLKNDQQKNMQINIELFKLLRCRYVLLVHHCQF